MRKQILDIIAKKYGVALSEQKEQGKKVYGLHGLLSNCKAAAAEVLLLLAPHYYTEQADTGVYLYNGKYSWF